MSAQIVDPSLRPADPNATSPRQRRVGFAACGRLCDHSYWWVLANTRPAVLHCRQSACRRQPAFSRKTFLRLTIRPRHPKIVRGLLALVEAEPTGVSGTLKNLTA